MDCSNQLKNKRTNDSTKVKFPANTKAIIFDLDGTLFDSLDVWNQIDIAFLSKRGLPVPPYYVAEISAKSFEEAAHYTIDLFGLNERPEDLMEEWNELARYEYAHHVGLLPHAKEYLFQLKQAGFRLAVATGAQESLYKPCLQNNGISDLFEVCCSVDEVGKGKAYPDIFLYTAQKLNLLPEQCVVFDDVLPAILSAKKAGMIAYGIYNEYSKQDRAEMEQVADGYFIDFREAPIHIDI